MLIINPTFVHRLQGLAEGSCYEIYFYRHFSSDEVDIRLTTTIQTGAYSYESVNAQMSLDIRAIPDGFGAEALEFANYVFDTLETKLLKEINSTISSKKEHHTMFVKKEYPTCPEIKNVIFNPPATIVFWTDGSKTVVKAQNGEFFDPEKGLAMAIAKKHFGNKGHYFEEIKNWTEKYEESLLTASSIQKAIQECIKDGTHDSREYEIVKERLLGPRAEAFSKLINTMLEGFDPNGN